MVQANGVAGALGADSKVRKARQLPARTTGKAHHRLRRSPSSKFSLPQNTSGDRLNKASPLESLQLNPAYLLWTAITLTSGYSWFH